MDLKDYREMPDEGLFEKIERRVRLRHAAKVTGIVLAVAVVAGAALWGVENGKMKADDHVVQTGQAELNQSSIRNSASDMVSQNIAEQADLGTEKAEPRAVVTELNNESLERKTENQEIKTEPLVAKNEVAAAEPGIERTDPGSGALEQKTENVEATVQNQEPRTEKSEASAPKSGAQQPTQTENVLWAPNIIAPMADDAANRVFKVQSTTAVSNFQLVIYNRGGRKVFSTDNIDQGWDGTYNGSVLPQGAYVWVARFRDAEGALRQEKGSVVVVR